LASSTTSVLLAPSDSVGGLSTVSAFASDFEPPATPNTLAKKSQWPPDFFAGASSAGLESAAVADFAFGAEATDAFGGLDAAGLGSLLGGAFDSCFLVSAVLAAPLPAKAAKMSSGSPAEDSAPDLSAPESSAAVESPKLSSNSPLSSSSSIGSTSRALLLLK